ncbi:DUF547 domain-containing protein [Nitrosomonas sp.]|uniref:DUF547 domain-containing protein n=1 Tax=Nitrosomonas sp. TaxID=42353 RepID=UPI0025EDADA7|nr:DUF547 domain-containing protein [Nitrosomonas sp.]MBV6446908.1 hypothetical protein [Nitrosomonas sp.]
MMIMMMKRLLLAFALLVSANTALAAEFDHSVWNGLLQNHVQMINHGQASQVDYDGFLQKRAVLRTYLSQLSAVNASEFSIWSRSERLAFLINAYNAYTIDLILTRYPKLDSIKDLGSFLQTPWKKHFVPLFGKILSLDDIEHGMIRKSGDYNEPRIHFAVNCASIGCPGLLNEAYISSKLEAQLETMTRAFLADRSRNRYNVTTGRLEVSKIFDWYREDFERGWKGWHKLDQFFAHYADSLTDTPEAKASVIAGGVKIRFLDYDWVLNKQK